MSKYVAELKAQRKAKVAEMSRLIGDGSRHLTSRECEDFDNAKADVERADQDFRELAAAAGPDPRDQILAIFDKVLARVDSEQFRGCVMMMTLAEFPDPGLPAHRNAVSAKSWLRKSIGELTGRLGVDDPAELADHLTLVLCRSRE